MLAERLVKEGRIKGIDVRDVTVHEGKLADEMMLIGSGILVKPVLQWDDHFIGDGKKLSLLCKFELCDIPSNYIRIMFCCLEIFSDRQRRSCN